ncbi:MAG: WD40 repeat domain-containing protein [Anaerolineaceae bacterium]|nr:WD40 repeat domain-containing protein [Anaerolineaceae bacterium]
MNRPALRQISFIGVTLILLACGLIPLTVEESEKTITPSLSMPKPQEVFLGSLGLGSAIDVAWSPDGDILAVLSSTGVRTYDPQTWQASDPLPDGAFKDRDFRDISFTPDGKKIIFHNSYFTSGSTYWQYDIQSKEMLPWHGDLITQPDSKPIFSPDGELFAFQPEGSYEENRANDETTLYLEIRNTATGVLQSRLELTGFQRGNTINDFFFSLDGKQLLTASDDHYIRIWDTSSGQLIRQLAHDSEVNSLSISPDGKVLASVGNDAVIRFWSLPNGGSLYTLRGFEQDLKFVSYIDNGSKILVAQRGEESFRVFPLNERYLPLEPDRPTLEFGGEVLSYLSYYQSMRDAIRIDPVNSRISVIIEGAVTIYDATSGLSQQPMPYTDGIKSIILNSNGDLLVLVDSNVHLWDVTTRQWIATLPIDLNSISDIAFHPNGEQLAIVDSAGYFEIWDAVNQTIVVERREKSIYDGPRGPDSYQVAFSPDGKSLALSGNEGINIWDAGKGVIQKRIRMGPWDASINIAFTMDGSELLILGYDGFWRCDLQTGELTQMFSFKAEHASLGQDYLVTSNTIYLGGNLWENPTTIDIYDSHTGQLLFEEDQCNNLSGLAQQTDGRLLAIVQNNQITLMDVVSRQEVLSITTRSPYLISFSSNGGLMAASTGDGEIYLWDVSYASQYASQIAVEANEQVRLPTSQRATTPLRRAQITRVTVDPALLNTGILLPETIMGMVELETLGPGFLYSGAWSPDGKTLAVGGYPGVYLFQNGQTEPDHFFPTEYWPEELLFSADGKYLVAASNMEFHVWDLATHSSILQDDDFYYCEDSLIAFSPGGDELSFKCRDTNYRWSLPDGKLLSRDFDVECYSPSPDGRLSLRPGISSVNLFDCELGQVIETFDRPGMNPRQVELSPDGKTLAILYVYLVHKYEDQYRPSSDENGLVELWRVSATEPSRLLTTLTIGKWYPDYILYEPFNELLFSSDSRRLVIGSGDGNAQMWDVATGSLLASMPVGRKVTISSDGSKLVSFGETTQIWEITPGRQPRITWEIPGFGGYHDEIKFTSSGKQLVALSNQTYRFWTQEGGKFDHASELITTPGTATHDIQISTDGNWLAYSTQFELVLGRNDPQLPNWQTLAKYPEQISSPFGLSSRSLTFSPDSSLLVALDINDQPTLWRLDQPTASPLLLSPALSYGGEFNFSPDGKELIGNKGIFFYLWDTKTGQLLREWKLEDFGPSLIHPGSDVLAIICNYPSAIKLYDLQSGTLLLELSDNNGFNDIALSPDGQLLVATQYHQMKIWEVASGRLIRTIEGYFRSITFSPDGKLLASSNGIRIRIFGLPASGD